MHAKFWSNNEIAFIVAVQKNALVGLSGLAATGRFVKKP